MSNKQTKFERIIVDADKFLLTAAKDAQIDYIEATNKTSGEKMEYKNITEFKAAGNNKEDWLIENKSKLRDDITNHIDHCKLKFSYDVGFVKKLPYANQYTLVLGGDKPNFRYDVAKILPYKGLRPPKPILFEEVRQAVFSQYKKKVHVADGVEADDVCAMYGSINQTHFNKTGEWKYLLAYQDKDLNMIPGPHIRIGSYEEGIKWITPTEACYAFCCQMLKGDKSVDNILGLENINDSIAEMFGIKIMKSYRGCGEATAEKILADCNTSKELLERAVQVYKMYYTEPRTFLSHDGNEYTYTWKEYFAENAKLLWMHRSRNLDWDVFTDLIDKMNIDYA